MKVRDETRAIDFTDEGRLRVAAGHALRSRTRKQAILLLALIVAALAMLLVSQRAHAANPTFSIVGPSEWNLPIVPHANVFMQSGIGQVSTSAWDAQGDREDIAGTHLYAGITRFAQLFSFKSLPNVGFFWEVLVPELSVQGTGVGVSGIGDPLLDFSIYFKPTKNSTVGFQNLVSMPFGDNDLSDHFWEYLPDFFWDANLNNWEFDGTLGVGFASDKHFNGVDTNIGNTYYGQFSVLYHVTKHIAPFVNFNYQNNRESTDIDSGALAPGAAPVFACANPGGCHEDVAGAGVKFTFKSSRWLSLWYAAGISGANTVRTQAVYLRFVNIF